ncbi:MULTISPECIES: chaplin [unclassified Streptomyces]|uniref:chaplin n=1 Tax=unclassified Streptomyces TaxID=2593676 RepID=UPI0033BDA02B
MSRISKVAAVMAGTGALIAGGAGLATADAGAGAVAAHSPGVGSGNAVQVPVHVPVNVCGNTVNVIALLNPAFGNTCANVSDHHEAEAEGDYGYGH